MVDVKCFAMKNWTIKVALVRCCKILAKIVAIINELTLLSVYVFTSLECASLFPHQPSYVHRVAESYSCSSHCCSPE